MSNRQLRAATAVKWFLVAITVSQFLAACAGTPASYPAVTALQRADIAYKKGSWLEAEQGYRTVIASVPKDAYAYMRLGNTLTRQARFEEAAVAYRESLVRDIDSAKAYNNLAMVRLLQAEAALESTVKHAKKDDVFADHARHMLIALKSITRIQN